MRQLAVAAAEIEDLKLQTGRLEARDRDECRSLLQSVELRSTQTAQRVENLALAGDVSTRRWGRLDKECLDLEEHLGYLAKTIRGRASRQHGTRRTEP